MWSFVFEWNSTWKHVVLESRSKYTKIVLNMYLIKQKLIYYHKLYIYAMLLYIFDVQWQLGYCKYWIAIRVYSTIL